MKLIKKISPNLNLIEADPFLENKLISKKFDIVISAPPISLLNTVIIENSYKKKINSSIFLLLNNERYVSDSGRIIFLFPTSILTEENKKMLKQRNLFVDAAFFIEGGLNNTSISSYLFIIKKKPVKETFVAAINNSIENNDIILQNYFNRIKGASPQLGSLAKFDDFTSVKNLSDKETYFKLSKNYPFPLISVKDVTNNISRITIKNKKELFDKSNIVFLPAIGNSLVVTEPNKMQIKETNYFVLELNEKANNLYVSKYLNSALGRASRRSLERGSTIPFISRSALYGLQIHLPPLSDQLNMIETATHLEEVTLQLNEMARHLWNFPRRINKIKEVIDAISEEKSFDKWIDSLPFPVSSILWQYHATNNFKNKVEHLLHFFEALSEFLVLILLSAVFSKKDFYQRSKSKWFSSDENFSEWYLKASFGNWNHLYSRLAKFIRTSLSDKELRNNIIEIFGNPPEEFITSITNKSIANILTEVAEYRNKWKGHSGVSSLEENRNRAIILEGKVNELRAIITDNFSNSRIIAPIHGIFRKDIFTYNIKYLKGSKTPFMEDEIISLYPLDASRLYLHHLGQNKPLKLLPLMKYVENVNAFYFYTSFESNHVRWISYHFEKDPELKEPLSDEVNEIFQILG